MANDIELGDVYTDDDGCVVDGVIPTSIRNSLSSMSSFGSSTRSSSSSSSSSIPFPIPGDGGYNNNNQADQASLENMNKYMNEQIDEKTDNNNDKADSSSKMRTRTLSRREDAQFLVYEYRGKIKRLLMILSVLMLAMSIYSTAILSNPPKKHFKSDRSDMVAKCGRFDGKVVKSKGGGSNDDDDGAVYNYILNLAWISPIIYMIMVLISSFLAFFVKLCNLHDDKDRCCWICPKCCCNKFNFLDFVYFTLEAFTLVFLSIMVSGVATERRLLESTLSCLEKFSNFHEDEEIKEYKVIPFTILASMLFTDLIKLLVDIFIFTYMFDAKTTVRKLSFEKGSGTRIVSKSISGSFADIEIFQHSRSSNIASSRTVSSDSCDDGKENGTRM